MSEHVNVYNNAKADYDLSEGKRNKPYYSLTEMEQEDFFFRFLTK